jgi:uncharacterized membrane protein
MTVLEIALAAAAVFLSGVVYLSQHGTVPGDFRSFHGEPADLCSPFGILRDALKLNGRGMIQLGVLLLIATPVARVVLTVYAFGREHDWLYVLITGIVLAVLLFSLFFGQAEGGR